MTSPNNIAAAISVICGGNNLGDTKAFVRSDLVVQSNTDVDMKLYGKHCQLHPKLKCNASAAKRKFAFRFYRNALCVQSSINTRTKCKCVADLMGIGPPFS